MQFIIRWLATAVAVGAAVWLVPGIAVLGTTESWIAVAITGLALSLIDMSIKPLLQLLSLPITCLTFGIFYLVVNTAMLYLAAWLSNGMFNVGFYISSFGSAFFASIVISIVSAIMNSIVVNNFKRARPGASMRGRGSSNCPVTIVAQASQTRCCPSKFQNQPSCALPQQVLKPTTLHAPAASRTRRNAARGSPSKNETARPGVLAK